MFRDALHSFGSGVRSDLGHSVWFLPRGQPVNPQLTGPAAPVSPRWDTAAFNVAQCRPSTGPACLLRSRESAQHCQCCGTRAQASQRTRQCQVAMNQRAQTETKQPVTDVGKALVLNTCSAD